jgi:signal transduction histidine kinase
MRILERIRSDNDETGYWPLQAVIDTLATSQNVPVRCVSANHVKELFAQESDLGNRIREHFASEADFRRAVREIAKDPIHGISRIKSQSKLWNFIFPIDPFLEWLVVPSFSNPLFVLLREKKLWSIWETVWCINTALEAAQSYPSVLGPLQYGEAFGDRLHSAAVYDPTSDFVVFAGPVWRPLASEPSDQERDTSNVAIVQALLTHLSRTPQEYTDGIPRDRIIRNVTSRSALHYDELKLRLLKVARALEEVLKVDIPDAPIAAREYESLALHILEAADHRDIFTIEREIPLPKGVHTEHRPADSAVIALQIWVDESGEFKGRAVQWSLDHAPQSIAVAPPQYQQAYGSLYERTNVNHSNYMLERISLLRLWLQSIYLALPIVASPVADSATDLPRAGPGPQILDRLSRRLMVLFGADACNIYRYDSIDSSLIRVGSFIRYLERAGNRKQAAELMRNAASDRTLRARSLAYRCVDTEEIIFPANARVEEMLIVDSQQPPRQLLVIPLKIHDRMWGVIEILALHPYQLLESAIRWADELSQALMPIIYDRLLLQKLSEMNNTVLSKNLDPDSKYQIILKELAGLILASSGALYIQHQRRTGEYECRAFFGRGWNDTVPLPGFASDDASSISARLLQKKKLGWQTGKIGEGLFGEDWLRKPKNAALRNAGHTHVAIFLLVDSQGYPFGSITMTSVGKAGFTETWSNLILFLSKNAGVLVESVKKEVEQLEARREYQAHALKTRVDRVLGGVELVNSVLSPFFDRDKLAPILESFLRRKSMSPGDLEVADALRTALGRPQAGTNPSQVELAKVLEDLREHLAALRVSAVYLSGGNNEEDPRFATASAWRGTWADLRGCLLTALKPINQEWPIQTPTRFELPNGVKLRMPPTELQEILNNVIDNAYKYNHRADGPPLLSCRVQLKQRDKKVDAEVYLEVRNLAPPLTRDDELKIGERRFRADYAKNRHTDGAGLGVTFCIEESRRWGAKFNYSADRIKDRPVGKLVWHRARLHFPPECVRIEETDWRGGKWK